MKRRRPIPGKRMRLLRLYICFAAAAALIIFTFTTINERLLPMASAMAVLEVKNRINAIIFDTINNTVLEGDIVTADFYNKAEDADGNLKSLAVNTILVNALCAEVADNISAAFMASQAQTVSIPAGALTGIGVLSNLGPRYSVKMLPGGNAAVDYETKFEAVGINQINFQVWLNVAVSIQIVNPLQTELTVVERKVSLVNTVFSGKVPENFIGSVPVDVVN